MTGGRAEPDGWVWLGHASRFLVLLLAAHLLYAALTLRIEYYDGYAYLSNARRLLGDGWAFYHPARPPLIPALMTPAVALARLGPPANAGLLVLPHLLAALLGLGSALSIYLLLRRALSAPLAWLGLALFLGSRLCIRYGPHVLTDLPVTGLVALSFHLYLGARSNPSVRRYAALGLAIAGTILAKYTMGLIVPALLVAEAALEIQEQRLDRRRVLLLLITLALSLLAVAGLHVGLFLSLFGDRAIAVFRSAFTGEVSVNVLKKGDSWLLQLWFAMVMQAPSLMLFTVVGVVLRVRRLCSFDRVMLAWLLVLGGGVLLVPSQIAARYTLPALPALIYFALTAIQDLQARLTRKGVDPRQARLLPGLPLLLLLATVYTAADQVWLDQDPVLRGDAQRLSVVQGLAARRGGSLRWLGGVHNLYPSRWIRVDTRWSSSMFRLESFGASYLAGTPVARPALTAGRRLPLARVLAELGVDGDAYLVVDERRVTLDDVEAAPNPIEVWSLQRHALTRGADDARRFVDENGDWVLRQLPGQGLEVERGDGAFLVLSWQRAVGESSRELGSCVLRAGARCTLDDTQLERADTLILLRVQRTLIEADGRIRPGPSVPAS